MAQKIKVAILDDHPAVLVGLACLLFDRDDMEVVGQFAAAEEAAAFLATSQDAIVVVADVRLGGTTAFEQMGRAKKLNPRLKVVYFTGYADALSEGIPQHADGFLDKSDDLKELLGAITIAAEGGAYFSSAIRRSQRGTLASLDKARLSLLTSREIDVLKHIGDGMSVKQIAARLAISPKTVARHKANIMIKLNLHSHALLALYAIRTGQASV